MKMLIKINKIILFNIKMNLLLFRLNLVLLLQSELTYHFLETIQINTKNKIKIDIHNLF